MKACRVVSQEVGYELSIPQTHDATLGQALARSRERVSVGATGRIKYSGFWEFLRSREGRRLSRGGSRTGERRFARRRGAFRPEMLFLDPPKGGGTP
jgi:hypothetical protein